MDRRRRHHHLRAGRHYGQGVTPLPVLCLVLILGLFLDLFLGLPLASSANAGPPSARGAALAAACVVCHGPEGRSQGAIPGLDGLPADAFRQAMQAFRTGDRGGTVMPSIARGLAAADIEAVAAHFTKS